MDKIAFIIGETFLHWNSIFLVLAGMVASLFFLAFYLGRSGNTIGAFLALPISFCFSIVLARFVHWYCQGDSYVSLEVAMSNFVSGGYALCGVFAGCFLAALLLRLLHASKDLPEMLDCMALAGLAGIGVGRLGSFFTNADRGNILDSSWSLPYTWPIANTVTGVEENRIAIFLIQAVLCGAFFLILTLFWLFTRKKGKSGDTFLLFLLIYGASQAIMDSLRYDSLYLRSNGFVSLVQILGASAMLVPIVVFSIRFLLNRGWRWWVPFLWIWMIVELGFAGFMEYYVQRHGDQALFSYSHMAGALLRVILLTVVIYSFGGHRRRKK